MNSDNFQKIKDRLPELCRYLAERAFPTFLVLAFVSLIFGGCLFYKYGFLADKKELEISGMTAQFKEDLYQKVIIHQQDRQVRFDEAAQKEHVDIFR